MKTHWHLCPDDGKWTWTPNEFHVNDIPFDFNWSGLYCFICDWLDDVRNSGNQTRINERQKQEPVSLKDQLKLLTKFVKRVQKNDAKRIPGSTSKSTIGTPSTESKLKVYTARIDSTDPERLNITRKSGSTYGRCFAPSWNLLTRFKVKQEGKNENKDQEVEFGAFTIAYIEEMKSSYVSDNVAWTNLLLSKRIVLICYCTNHEKCHRTVLARDVLPNYGAEYCGELKSEISDLSSSSNFQNSKEPAKTKQSKKSNNGQGSLF